MNAMAPCYKSLTLTFPDTNEDADHRYLMFSATFNKHCRELARKFLASNHVRIRIGRAGSTHPNVEQQVS
jgi:ATP-dependent RNA helicase DDX3X